MKKRLIAMMVLLTVMFSALGLSNFVTPRTIMPCDSIVKPMDRQPGER